MEPTCRHCCSRQAKALVGACACVCVCLCLCACVCVSVSVSVSVSHSLTHSRTHVRFSPIMCCMHQRKKKAAAAAAARPATTRARAPTVQMVSTHVHTCACVHFDLPKSPASHSFAHTHCTLSARFIHPHLCLHYMRGVSLFTLLLQNPAAKGTAAAKVHACKQRGSCHHSILTSAEENKGGTLHCSSHSW